MREAGGTTDELTKRKTELLLDRGLIGNEKQKGNQTKVKTIMIINKQGLKSKAGYKRNLGIKIKQEINQGPN